MKFSTVFACLFAVCFAVDVNTFRMEEGTVREKRQAVCTRPFVSSDAPSYYGQVSGLVYFPQWLCNTNSLNLFLNCSGEGSVVSSVTFNNVNMANAIFTYYDDETVVFTEEILGDLVTFKSTFEVPDGPVAVTRIEITFDRVTGILLGPCVRVPSILVSACCPGASGCPLGLQGIFCNAFGSGFGSN